MTPRSVAPRSIEEAACLTTLRPLIAHVRTDVTAVRRASGAAWTTEPLDLDSLRGHLNGGPARGVCPIKAGGSACAVGVLDLDAHKGATPWSAMANAAAALHAAGAAVGIAFVGFRSYGGKGIHLYALWREPQDARGVRHAMTQVLARCGLESGTRGVAAGEVEIFPKQDSVPAGGFGNQFILPLAGESVPLDPLAGWEPLPRATPVEWAYSAPVPAVDAPAPIQRDGEAEVDLASLRDALTAIPPSVIAGYDDWVRMGMALHHATGGSDEGLDMWDAASRAPGAGEYAGREALAAKWAGFHDKDVSVTAGTIIAWAREHGWGAATADEFDEPSDREEVAVAAPSVSPTLRFAVEPVAEFAARPPPEWIVRGLLPRADLGVIYGAPGTGKTFVALDIAMAVARGAPWRGLRVRQGPVVYVCAEGSGGFRMRTKAYGLHHGVDLATVPLGVVHSAAPNLLEPRDTRDLIAALKVWGPASLIVIDTLAASMPGGDENSGADVGRALAHCRALQRVTGALVLLVAHAGKDATKGVRGWSGIRAACDVELEVVKLPNGRAIRTTKQKDGNDSGAWGFALDEITVGSDDDGELVTSCVAVPAELPDRVVAVGRALGKVELLLLAVVTEMGEVQRTGIEIDAVLTEAARRMPAPEGRDTRKRSAQRALTTLLATENIGIVAEDDKTLTLE